MKNAIDLGPRLTIKKTFNILVFQINITFIHSGLKFYADLRSIVDPHSVYHGGISSLNIVRFH